MLNERNPSSGNGRSRMDQAKAKVQEKAKSIFSDGKGQVSESLNRVARAFRQTGEQLRNQNYGSAAGYADQAADGIERISGYLSEKNVDELLDEAQDLARRQPFALLAGAFAAGFIMARVIKGSRQATM